MLCIPIDWVSLVEDSVVCPTQCKRAPPEKKSHLSGKIRGQIQGMETKIIQLEALAEWAKADGGIE
jgi:hypothetical protein